MSVETSTPEVQEFTREDLLACVDREIRLRQHFYAWRVREGKMTEAEATREIALMRAVRLELQKLELAQASLNLFGGEP